jgi:hypothetical protein
MLITMWITVHFMWITYKEVVFKCCRPEELHLNGVVQLPF